MINLGKLKSKMLLTHYQISPERESAPPNRLFWVTYSHSLTILLSLSELHIKHHEEKQMAERNSIPGVASKTNPCFVTDYQLFSQRDGE